MATDGNTTNYLVDKNNHKYFRWINFEQLGK